MFLLGNVGQKLISTMLTDGELRNGKVVDYAFALRNGNHRGFRTVQHGGALRGYCAQLLRFPEENFSAVILSNLASFDPSSLPYKVADCYLEEHFKSAEISAEEDKEPTERENGLDRLAEITLTEKQLEAFAGEYYSDELQVLYRIFVEDSQLFVQIKNGPRIEMKASGKDVFDGKGRMSFNRGANGNIEGFTLDVGGVKNLRFEKALREERR